MNRVADYENSNHQTEEANEAIASGKPGDWAEEEQNLPIDEQDNLDAHYWLRERKAVPRPDGRMIIGLVGAPPQQEATSGKFSFWTANDCLIEKSQIVTCESRIGSKLYTYYAIIDEVYRRSRKKNMAEEVDRRDGDLAGKVVYESEGYTFAEATILRVTPMVLAPPREDSQVLLADAAEAALAYGLDEVENPLALGLIKNGGESLVGPGKIDEDYLLGTNGGHLNVTGAAGRGTKSSFLLTVAWLLLQKAKKLKQERPSDQKRLKIVPIIFNVKNFDLFHIDRASRRFNLGQHKAAWLELGVSDPRPFEKVTFLAPEKPGGGVPIATGRLEGVTSYSWSLRNIIEQGLLTYLFAEEDNNDPNFGALVLDIETWLTQETLKDDGSVEWALASGAGQPETFKDLVEWVKQQSGKNEETKTLKNHHIGTWKKVYRRLFKVVKRGRGVLTYEAKQGQPLSLTRVDTADPVVVDLYGLAGLPELQRFVVAAIFHQLKQARSGDNRIDGLVYLVVLDELNRFAPRGSRDPITQLIETVAAEMRSEGIILLGGQQQASKVSERVIENSAIRVLGKTGPLELAAPVWSFLSVAAKYKAQNLGLSEKLVIQDNFREPMHLQIPFPAWAMRREEAVETEHVSPKDEAASPPAVSKFDKFLERD